MASPQKENGFTPIANELFEAFYQCKLLEYERVCVMHIWRKTYGWNKKDDWIANSQFSAETGIPKPHVTRTIKGLIDKKVIVRDGKKVTVNKNYDEWLVEWRIEQKITSPGNKITSPGNKKLPHQVPTKERKKLLQKKLGEVVTSPVLKVNQNDMAWNRLPDDEEEIFIDADGDGTAKPEKKQTKKYPNAPAVRKVFLEVLGLNPLDWNKNITQLQACENLYTERGIEKIRNALEFYKEHRDLEYCPSISSPLDLDRKYANLSKFKTKITNS